MKKYIVDIFGLKNKKHFFEFEVDKTLFEHFGNENLQDANLKVLLALDKSETMITATVEVDGMVDLVCDRSLRVFKHPLNLNDTIYYKFGEKFEELSDEVIIIPTNYADLDFSQLIYDTVVLAIPPKIIHPDLLDEEDDEFTFSTSTDNEKKEVEQKEEMDPRWEKLKNLKFDKK